MISYAQNFEDVILRRALKHVDNGFYIDVGAQDPITDSVSLAFYEQGWRGVHVEPTPTYAKALSEARQDETVIQAAIGAKGGIIPFWEFPETGLSTGAPDIAAGHEAGNRTSVRIEVPCIPLSQLLDAHGERPIHWLKIDVEGMEDDVIESWPPSPVRPWIVVVESTKPSSQEASYTVWEPKLVAMGYEFVYFDGVNRFYVHEEQAGLKAAFGPGPNWFDSFQLSRTSAYASQLAHDIANKTHTIEQLSQAVDAARAEIVAQAAVRDREIARLAQEYDAVRQALAAVHSSTSWRLTAPLRAFKRWTGSPLEGIWAWITLKPGSRPRRMARKALAGLSDWVRAHPRLRSALINLLRRYPSLFGRFRRMARSQMLAASAVNEGSNLQFSDLSPHAKTVYQRLQRSIVNRQGKA